MVAAARRGVVSKNDGSRPFLLLSRSLLLLSCTRPTRTDRFAIATGVTGNDGERRKDA